MARAVGINHIAIEVGSLDEALEFYGSKFELELRGRIPGMAFVDMGDQFLALAERSDREPDAERHFGLVVDDRAAVLAAVREAGVEIFGGNSFRDPWGNHVQVVEYGDIQFTKARRSCAEWVSSSRSPSRRWQSSGRRAWPARRSRRRREACAPR